MKNIVLLFFISILLTSLFSCQNRYNNSQILVKAEKLVISNPDSVLILLENIKSPASLSKKEYATYLLLQVKAKDKMERDLSYEAPLAFSIDYFTKKGLHKQAAYAYFYQSRIYQSQNQPELAMEYCSMAKDHAEKAAELNLLGLIYHDLGFLHREQRNYEEAISNFRKSLSYFQYAKNEHYAIYMYKRIGDIFLVTTFIDSALTNGIS